jgi:hypothetical protein
LLLVGLALAGLFDFGVSPVGNQIHLRKVAELAWPRA